MYVESLKLMWKTKGKKVNEFREAVGIFFFSKFNVDFTCSDLFTDKKALQSSQNIEAGKKEATEESCEKPEKAKGIVSLSSCYQIGCLITAVWFL